MNELGQPFDHHLSHYPEKKQRNDFLTAQFIEVGIAIQMLDGTYAAAEYLKSKNVDMDMATRVLTKPLNRRTWRDWNYPIAS